ncbi:MAG: hypothetical protein JXA54_11865 [Candidatus Heimdallarchaeota archaeon]|nr:hypothetical protein [Candidatus Heimdallarchaeota archaeon]
MKDPMYWRKSLSIFLRENYTFLNNYDFEWAIIGSVASVLQGCHLVPKDIDIVIDNPKTIQLLGERMKKYTEKENSAGDIFSSNWLSSRERLVFEGTDQWGFHWSYVAWKIARSEVQVAHISAPKEFQDKFKGIWEAGPKIYPYLKQIHFDKYLIPVVPLEIQLETNMSRGLTERVQEILHIFQENGYDHQLLSIALDQNHLNEFESLMKNG